MMIKKEERTKEENVYNRVLLGVLFGNNFCENGYGGYEVIKVMGGMEAIEIKKP